MLDLREMKSPAFPEMGKAFCFQRSFSGVDYVDLREDFPHFPQYPQSPGSPVFTGVSADLGIFFLQKLCYTQSHEKGREKFEMKRAE